MSAYAAREALSFDGDRGTFVMVVGFSGHQNIPKQALAVVRGGIERALENHGDQSTSLSSLAEGADQLFAEAVLKLGWQLHVVIPCQHYDMTFGSPKTLRRFHTLLAKAARVETLDHPWPSEDAYLDAGKHIVDLSQVLVAVCGTVARQEVRAAPLISSAMRVSETTRS